jgi:hypothetical protein
MKPLEQVVVKNSVEALPELQNIVGVVVFVDNEYEMSVVYYTALNKYYSIALKDIESEGGHAKATEIQGSQHELSSDIEIDSDLSFFEGMYRAPGEHWGILIARKSSTQKNIESSKYRWRKTGVNTIEVVYPEFEKINLTSLSRQLSSYYPNSQWVEVSGPDSMLFR